MGPYRLSIQPAIGSSHVGRTMDKILNKIYNNCVFEILQDFEERERERESLDDISVKSIVNWNTIFARALSFVPSIKQ